MRHSRQPAPGFTLAEVLIAMALLGLIMVAAALGIQAAQESHTYNTEKTALTARTRGVLDRIALDVRRAASVEITIDGELAVTMSDGWVHTYAWDGAAGGNATYTETDPATISIEHPAGVPSDPAVLTGQVHALELEAAGDGCRVRLRLEGTHASSEATITATPGKILW
ncbi:MAG: prepilin-type N-terminal cleavage/methylation domain-containing protein [Planctomycetes bacterium]|nr:prepilin-type N-terminal cleavage/methylation domain-containing protein [Planctomycetota bacterium]